MIKNGTCKNKRGQAYIIVRIIKKMLYLCFIVLFMSDIMYIQTMRVNKLEPIDK